MRWGLGMSTRDLTVEDIADWLSPSQAIEILNAVYNDARLCKETMLEHLRAGMVQAIAEHTAIEAVRPKQISLFLIPAKDWTKVEWHGSCWKTGHLTYNFVDESSMLRSVGKMRHFNVRFEPESVLSIIKNVVPKSPSAPASPEIQGLNALDHNKGGAPRKAWWDDFWIEICRRIYDNELKVEKQADLERAMLDCTTISSASIKHSR
jgi:hypothetical protein